MLFLLQIGFVAGCATQLSTPIIDGLPEDVTKAQPLFDQRLKEIYPIGSGAQTLSEALAAQGFNVHRASDVLNGQTFQLVGKKDIEHFPCVDHWTVYWTSDATGAIENLAGNIQNTCP
jgi:hypothetical protein